MRDKPSVNGNIRSALSICLKEFLPHRLLDSEELCDQFFLVILRDCSDLIKKTVNFDFQYVK